MSKIDGEGVPYTVIWNNKPIEKNEYKGIEMFTAPLTGLYEFSNGKITLIKKMNEGDSIKISDVIEEIKNEN